MEFASRPVSIFQSAKVFKAYTIDVAGPMAPTALKLPPPLATNISL